jgi:hypothetical protein
VSLSRKIERLSLATGKREPFLDLLPLNATGASFVGFPLLSRDEKSYVYNQIRTQSVLYIATGLK